jgi:prepilin-type N-terminal cleavage/methylation domain-containing protein/prepilin-type processing-associated H-X9-DG protein
VVGKCAQRNAKAFSLIELLIVIAMIAILASLLSSALARAKSRAHSSACQSKLRQLGFALQMYRDDNAACYPFLVASTQPNETDQYWWQPITPYLRLPWTNLAFHCPSYKGVVKGLEDGHPRGSYAYNGWGTHFSWDSRLGLGSNHTPQSPREGVPDWKVKIPSAMFAIADARLVREEGRVVGMPVMWNRSGWAEPADLTQGRHDQRYNVLLCDGHVESIRRRDLIDPEKTARFFNIDHERHPETETAGN